MFYKIGVIQTLPDGQKLKGYKPVKFKKGVEVADKTRIKIKQAFENFYKKGYDYVLYLQINEFEILDDKINEYNESLQEVDVDDIF